MTKSTLNDQGLSRRKFFRFAGAGAAAVVATAATAGMANASGINLNSVDNKDISLLVHFSDNDYQELVMKNSNQLSTFKPQLLMRSYAYIDTNNSLNKVFSKTHAYDNSEQVLKRSKVVVSTCLSTLVEVAKNGGKALFVEGEDLTLAEQAKMQQHGIVRINFNDKGQLQKEVQQALTA